MIDEVLRRADAHVVVDDVEVPMLDDGDAHHVFRVLRVRDGDTVTVTDGLGRWRPCRVVGAALEPAGEVVVIARRTTPVTIGFAIPKQDRPEWIVQKLTEIGVNRIVLLHAARSVVRWSPERATKNMAKLRRVASEALQQSRGVWLPEIVGPIDAGLFLPGAAVAEPGADSIAAGDVTVAVGPEGGWSSDELASARSTVSIGSTVLRVETAAIVAATHVIMHVE